LNIKPAERLHRYVSTRHRPFFSVQKFASLKPHVDVDSEIFSYIHELFGDLPYAVALPEEDSMWHEFSKYSNFYPAYAKNHAYYSAVKFLHEELSCILHDPLQILTPESAARRVNKASSPGYPYSQVYKTKGEYLDGTARAPPADYVADVKEFFLRGWSFWSFTHKFDIRPIEKLRQMKIRGFTGGTVSENLACLMYLGDLFDRIAENWRLLPYTYGMNAFAGGWHFLTTRNPANISSWFVDDASSWDGSMPPVLVFDVMYDLLMRFDWLQPPAGFPPVSDALRIILEGVLSGPIINPYGVGCWTYTSNKSGGGATIQINSIARRFLWVWFCFCMGVSPRAIREETRQDVHGDDSRTGRSKRLEAYLSPEAFRDWCAKMFFTFHFKPYGEANVPIEKTKYLSRNCVKVREMWTYSVEDPLKLVASACLGASDEPPVGWTRPAYLLGRLIAITNELVMSEDVYDKMRSVVTKYICAHDREMRDDQSWHIARKTFVNRDVLLSRLLEDTSFREADIDSKAEDASALLQY
jgi:hypothetical protein